jgi:hypothetical protein
VNAHGHRLDLHRAFRALSPIDNLPGRSRQGRDELFDRIQRSRTRLARLPTPAIDRHLGSGGLDFLWQTTASMGTPHCLARSSKPRAISGFVCCSVSSGTLACLQRLASCVQDSGKNS